MKVTHFTFDSFFLSFYKTRLNQIVYHKVRFISYHTISIIQPSALLVDVNHTLQVQVKCFLFFLAVLNWWAAWQFQVIHWMDDVYIIMISIAIATEHFTENMSSISSENHWALFRFRVSAFTCWLCSLVEPINTTSLRINCIICVCVN